ncbi:hypothetical protein HN873_009690, partial [Arachis hypogaea]
RPVALLRRRGLGSSATAVAWSSALVTLHRRLVPYPVALHLHCLHLLNTSRQQLASSSSSRGPQQSTPVALHRHQV